MEQGYRFYDIAANLTDDQFGKQNSYDQRDQVVTRAHAQGCSHLLIASGCLLDAPHALHLAHRYPNAWITVGVHPCRANQPRDPKFANSPQEYFQRLEEQLVKAGEKVVAVGECGLDYDRLNYASKEDQLRVFPPHFALAEKYKLPMYLHNRNTGQDFYQLIAANRGRFRTGVVHSFTGSKEEARRIVELDLFIGVNGCSLKTAQNLEALNHIPLDRLLLETDSPYCQIRKSHAGAAKVKTSFPTKNKRTPGYLLKGRNEPCKIVQVLEVVSAQLNLPPEIVAETAFQNSIRLFHP